MLNGKKILVTRPAAQAKALIEQLESKNAKVICIPTIAIEPITDYTEIDRKISELSNYDWLIFTSANGVFYFFQRLQYLDGAITDTKIAVVGEKTAKKVQQFGYKVDAMPEKYVAENILEELGEVKNKKILMPVGNIARQELQTLLRKNNAQIDELVMYNTVNKKLTQEERKSIFESGIDYLTFMSPSAALSFATSIGEENMNQINAQVVCIGPKTAEGVKDLGFKNILIAEKHTTEGIVKTITNHLSSNHKSKIVNQKL